jgi:hypothetical protein
MLQQLLQDEGRALGASRRDDGVQRFEPLPGFLRVAVVLGQAPRGVRDQLGKVVEIQGVLRGHGRERSIIRSATAVRPLG